MIDKVAIPRRDSRAVPRLLLAALVMVALVGAFLLGSSRPVVSSHTGIAHSAEGAISVEADGWTYSVPLDGVMWIDSTDSWHDEGRPECLPPTGATRPITFGFVEVTVEGGTWRPVVWISCR